MLTAISAIEVVDKTEKRRVNLAKGEQQFGHLERAVQMDE